MSDITRQITAGLPDGVNLELLCLLTDMSGARVRQLSQEGIFKRSPDRLYPLVPNLQSYIRHLRGRAIGRGNARERLDGARAELAELQLERERGEVVPLDLVMTRLERLFHAMAARINAAPAKYGPVVSPGNARRGQQALERMTAELLADLRAFDLAPDEPEPADAADELSPTA